MADLSVSNLTRFNRMRDLILLSAYDLMLAALLVLALVGLSARLKLGIALQLVVAACRTTAQLLLVGLILKQVFEQAQLSLVLLITFVMLTVAAWEILARQKRKIKGWWGFLPARFHYLYHRF